MKHDIYFSLWVACAVALTYTAGLMFGGFFE